MRSGKNSVPMAPEITTSGEDRNDPDWQFRPMLTGVINTRPDKDNGGSCEYYEAGV